VFCEQPGCDVQQKENKQTMCDMKRVTGVLTVLIVLCWLSIPAFAEVGFGIKGGILMPDRDPFKDEFDSNFVLGGVLEFDSNIGPVVEADVEYYNQDSNNSKLGGKITLFPIVVSLKYNFFPRYRTTPFVGLGVGAFFFDREYAKLGSKSKTRYGTRVSGGIRFFEDRRMNLVLEAARNFVDFDNSNASSFEFTVSILFDVYPNVVGAP
jgi:hypothetical protein